MQRIGIEDAEDFLDLFAASAGDFLDGWFESGPFKAVFDIKDTPERAKP